jgi:hypothetical protein
MDQGVYKYWQQYNDRENKNTQRKLDGTHLLGKGLAVISCAPEEIVAIIIYRVSGSNIAMYIQRPLETIC